MTRRTVRTRRLHDDEAGQGMVEYALILALVSILTLGSLAALGGEVSGFIDAVAGVFG